MKVTRAKDRPEAYVSRLYTLVIARDFGRLDKACVWWNARVTNPQYVRIGRGVTVKANSWVYAVISDQEGNRFTPEIEIQDGVYLGHSLHLTAVQRVVIEAEAMIADFVYISDNFHDYRDTTKPIQKQRVYSRGPLVIKSGAFIGEGARIIGPVSVGKNSVVGANAVVTHDIPDYSVAVGIPARVIRTYDHGQWRAVEAGRHGLGDSERGER